MFEFDSLPHYSRHIGAALLALQLGASMPALALNPASKTFDQSFDTLTDITNAGGSCLVSGVACTSAVLVANGAGNAIEIKKTGFPLVSFPVTFGGNTYIDKQKGTVTFDYEPIGSPSGDWDLAGPAAKTFFYLRDPSVAISGQQTLKVGTYYDSVSGKNYMYFRYDATNGCVPGGTPACQRETSTSGVEPGVVMTWNPNTQHKITISWDLTGSKPYLSLYIDGTFGVYAYHNIDITGFNPTTFYVGSLNGSFPAQGRIDNLKIYSDVALDVTNPGPDYSAMVRDNGIWEVHETVHETTDAPAAVNIGGEPFIFYAAHDFEPIYEGSVPGGTTDPLSVIVKVLRNQHHTAFFNIYAGVADLDTVTASVSNLTNGSEVIDQSKIKIRTVHNWWQAGKRVLKEGIPAYVPELLLYDDTQVPSCTGSLPKPCTNGQFPSDPHTAYTLTEVRANTSRQFAITLDIPGGTVPGIYTGDITVSSSSQGYKTLPLVVYVYNPVLPQIDKIAALYNHSQYDMATGNELYVPQAVYEAQLDNMYEHGATGTLFYGNSSGYPALAASAGLTGFGGYLYGGNNSSRVGWLNGSSFAPYIYGQDEPDMHGTLADQMSKSKNIHAAGGLVVTAISKEWADNLNDSSFFPYTPPGSGTAYTFAEGKLDLANLNVEDTKASAVNYFADLLSGNSSVKAANPEVYYWQMDREEPRINRFYAGYHLWLTDLAGVFPYVYQKVVNNPFDDFDAASGSERDLNLVYPSLQGGIDTIQWEAFRAGLDDYRLLQLWKTLHGQVAAQPNNNAASRQATLDSLLTKYRSAQAFNTVSRAIFAADRETLIAEVDGMTSDLIDDDEDGVGDVFDNCPAMANPEQGDYDNDGIGDYCDETPGC